MGDVKRKFERPVSTHEKAIKFVLTRLLSNEYKNIEEQMLDPAPEREGFTVIEWGGTELKSDD